MNIDLTPELEQLVQSKVESGLYKSPSAVVEEALRLLDHRDEVFKVREDEIRQQIEEGWQSARRGELVDGEEVFDRMDAELADMERAAPKRSDSFLPEPRSGIWARSGAFWLRRPVQR
jgi:antitoxin ParD1/3/4